MKRVDSLSSIVYFFFNTCKSEYQQKQKLNLFLILLLKSFSTQGPVHSTIHKEVDGYQVYTTKNEVDQ